MKDREKRCSECLELQDKEMESPYVCEGCEEVTLNKDMKCDTCQFKKHYSTGDDEYPAFTTIEYCSKGHWENYTPDSEDKVGIFYNCADFLPCTQRINSEVSNETRD